MKTSNKQSVVSIVMLISTLAISAGCVGYTEEDSDFYKLVMLNGDVISSTTSDKRVTTSIVKFEGELYTCYETGAGLKQCVAD